MDYVEGARGVADPLQDAPKTFERTATRSSRPATPPTRSERSSSSGGGEPVAGLVYVSDGHGGWLQSESFGCSD